MRRIVIVLTAACVAVVSCSSHTLYANSWAVEVEGGRVAADALAQKYGFENRGQVGILKDVYNFVLPQQTYYRVGKGLSEPYSQVTDLMKNEGTVKYVEQQTIRKMAKKGYAPPTDPGWSQQWSLVNTGQTGVIQQFGEDRRDLNVEPVWIQGVTGCNVIVGVVDDGVEFTHPDLDDNYISGLDVNVLKDRGNAFPGEEDGQRVSHGTSCAGIIAMEKNNVCGVGVAYHASITGILLIAFGQTDVTEAKALGYRDDVIQIYSNSWGPQDTGFLVEGPDKLTKRALAAGVQEGRGGKGSIFVWAAGNGGTKHDSCAADGYVNSIYTIAIGSASSDGSPAYYDEMCSAKMAATFVNNPNAQSPHVTTTDSFATCTDEFDGTSAATPVAAGAIALVLEVNPNLTWRDVQYLIAYTSNPDILSGDDWVTNGAGLNVSHHFGFGAIDAEAMVTRARHWTNVPTQRVSSKSIPGTSSVVHNSFHEISASYDEQIAYVEHVVVQMTLTFKGIDADDYTSDESFYYYLYENLDYYYNNVTPNRGDIQIELTSPSGTTSTLLPYRPYDSWPGDYREWPFMSVHFWGENPQGEWSLIIRNRGEEGTLEVSNVQFTLYGTEQTPAAVAQIPAQCDPACARGCAAEGPGFCDSCRNYRNATSLECIDECSAEFDIRSRYCYNSSQPEPQCVRVEVMETDFSSAPAMSSGLAVTISALLVTSVAILFF